MKLKKMTMTGVKVLCAAAALCLIGCNNFFSPASFSSNKKTTFADSGGNLVTPYANMTSARAVQIAAEENPSIVDWRISRFFALLQKIDFESVYPWHGATISEYPVIIYYADSNTPRYYEFRVIKNGIEVGAITCNASKLEGEPVAYVSTMTHQVTAETAQQLTDISGAVRLAAINYPSQFVMRDTTVSARSVMQGEAIFKDALSGETLTQDAVFIERNILECLEKADEETLERLEINASDKTTMIAEAQEQAHDMASLWNSIDEIIPQILATTDEEIEREYQNPDAIVEDASRHIYASETTTVQYKMLNDWYSKRDWHNSLGYCGPAAVTFVALGLGEKANFDKIPLTNDKTEIKNLYNIFENTIGTGPKVISSLSKGLSTHTDYMIEQKLCHRWNDVNNHLNNYNLPVVSLRSGWYGDWGFHYRVIIGTQTDRKRDYHKISWWWFGWKSKYWTKDKYTHWYYLHDNTSNSTARLNKHVDGNSEHGNFWEKSGGVHQSTLGLVKHK
ncbi:MAG: hypothetical protein IJ191_00300 [Treponema sp.]|nr:hypothetical protein [Treponema sp.]